MGASAGFAGSLASGAGAAAADRTGGFLTSKGFTDDLTGGFRLPSGADMNGSASTLLNRSDEECGGYFQESALLGSAIGLIKW